jgi:hypothetical protein
MKKHVCVFCGERNVTKEHVIPKWVGEVLPKKAGSEWRHTERERSWATDHVNFTVKRVCARCNNGWMDHDIERPARPILTRMIHGEDDITLTPALQERVAAWTVKTHAMSQFRHATDIRPMGEELREALYERKMASEHRLTLPEDITKFVDPIWPPSQEPREWPPTWALDNPESLKAFALTWTNTGPPPV